MFLYSFVLILGITLSGLLNIFVWHIQFLDFALYSATGILGVALLAVIPHFLVRILPKKFFSPEKAFFHTLSIEKNFYDFIQIKKWKDKIPDAGGMASNFAKKNLQNPKDKEYLYKFLVETCYSETVHIVCALDGFLIIILPFTFSVLLPVAIINCFLHLLPAMVQRYIRPRLLNIYTRIQKTAATNLADDSLKISAEE